MDTQTGANNSLTTVRPHLSQFTTMTLEMSFPMLGVGLLTLVISLCFCCYLWKLKRQSQAERGYSQLRFTEDRKKVKNDVCPICLEEFQHAEELAVSRCRHGFHMRCLQQWLSQHNTCPMCKMCITPALETTGLIPTSSSV